MRTLLMTVSLLVAVLLPGIAGASSLGLLRISLIRGDVQIRTEDTRDWVPAALNIPLGEGDSIWVPDGARVELQLRNGTFVRLDERSALDISTLTDDTCQLFLAQGRAYVKFSGNDDTQLQFDTEAATFVADRRARFRVAVFGEDNAALSSLKGEVVWEDDRGPQVVSEGSMVTVDRDGFGEFEPLRPVDEWERWNRALDNRYDSGGRGARYLPGELQPYASDLDANGRWEYDAEYGYTWWPTATVNGGWSPYREGRWVWMRGDYVWVSSEPWGWVPYHYGRWAFRPGRGWCWVPPARRDVYWGPGYVGWVSTPTYTAWVPLAPGDIYYGHGNYGRNSVNVTNVTINNTTVVTKVVYRNVNVRNAVTVVKHDDFVTGRRERTAVRDNPFLRERISIGRPNIPPQRTSVMPVVREIPVARRPPRSVFLRHGDDRRPVRPPVRDAKERWPRDNRSAPVPASPGGQRFPRQERIDNRVNIPPGRGVVPDRIGSGASAAGRPDAGRSETWRADQGRSHRPGAGNAPATTGDAGAAGEGRRKPDHLEGTSVPPSKTRPAVPTVPRGFKVLRAQSPASGRNVSGESGRGAQRGVAERQKPPASGNEKKAARGKDARKSRKPEEKKQENPPEGKENNR